MRGNDHLIDLSSGGARCGNIASLTSSGLSTGSLIAAAAGLLLLAAMVVTLGPAAGRRDPEIFPAGEQTVRVLPLHGAGLERSRQELRADASNRRALSAWDFAGTIRTSLPGDAPSFLPSPGFTSPE